MIDAMVSEVISYSTSGFSWLLLFSRDLYDWEVNWVADLMLRLNDVFFSPSFVDQRVWALESSGNFSTKLVFLSLSSSIGPTVSFLFSKIWKPPIPPQVKAFAWTVVLN